MRDELFDEVPYSSIEFKLLVITFYDVMFMECESDGNHGNCTEYMFVVGWRCHSKTLLHYTVHLQCH